MRRHWSKFILAGLLLVLVGCQQQPEALHLAGRTMGTTWSAALLPASGSPAAEDLQGQLQNRLDRINALMSTYDPASEISQFNDQTSTDWFPVSAETAKVVALSGQISELTGGAFDISVGPLVELWGFGAVPRGEHPPSDAQIDELLSRVGYRNLEQRLQPAALRKLVPGLRIDLSAVAKGYAVDQLAGLLEEQGVSDYLVEVGGELRIRGQRGDGTPWKIAIEKPQEEIREVATVFPLTGTGLATSGNYRNYYEIDGQRYAHTIDPVSGRPIRHKLASATVLDPSCARADALATALMVMGEERGRKFCEEHRIAAYFLIHEQTDLTVYASPAFQTFVEGLQK